MLKCLLVLGFVGAATAVCTFVLTPAVNGTDIWQTLTFQKATETPFVLCLANATAASPFLMGYFPQISFPSSDLRIHPQVIYIMDIFDVTVTGNLTFLNVVLTGKYMIWSDCEEEWCTHCLTDAYLYTNSAGQKVTVIDQFPVDKSAPYYNRSQCNFYQGNLPNNQGIFFTLSLKASITFQNVEINNIRVQAYSFIFIGGQNYIGFLNTSIIRMDFNQRFIYEIAATAASVVEFDGLYVTGFNRDQPYPIGDSIGIGFLSLYSSTKDILYIRNSVFEYNFLYGSTVYVHWFLRASVTHLEITSTVFRYCMQNYNFLFFDSGSSDQSIIRNVTFESNYYDMYSMIMFNHFSGNRSIVVENCTFVNNIGVSDPVITIATQCQTPSILNFTMANLGFINNRFVGNPYGVVYSMCMTSVVIEVCTFSDNLVFEPSFPYNIYLYMLDNGLINNSPVLQSSRFSPGSPFNFQVYFGSSISISVTNTQIVTSEQVCVTGLSLEDIKSYISVTYSSFSVLGSIGLNIATPTPTLIKNCNFLSQNKRGLYYSGSTVIVEGSIFYHIGTPNSDSNGLVVYASLMNISNCVFEGNQASLGSAINFFQMGNATSAQDQAVHISNCLFKNNFASTKGGDISIDGVLSSFPLLLYIGNCTFSNSSSLVSGGSIVFTNMIFTSALIEYCTFRSGSTDTGGMIQVNYITGNFTIKHSSFLNIIVPSGSILSVGNLGTDPSQETSVTLSNSEISNCLFEKGIAISILPELSVFSVSNTYYANTGIVISNNQGTFSDVDSIFDKNSNAQNPCYYQSGQTTLAEFTGTLFTRNWATNTAGVAMLSDRSTATFTHCKFDSNNGGQVTGVMHIERNSNVRISGCEFINNWATSAATLYLFEIQSTVPLSIFDSVFIGNAGDGLLQMVNSNMYAQNVTIRETQSAIVAGLILIQSNLNLVESSISQINGTLGCVLYGVLGSNFTLLSSVVSDISCEGESLFLLSSSTSNLNITASNFDRIISKTAAVISIGEIGQLVLDSFTISNVDAPLAVFSLQSINVDVLNSVFSYANCVVVLAEQSSLQISNSSFENVTALTDVGAVNCFSCWNVNLSGVILINVSATVTAGVNVTQSNSVLVERSRFEGLRGGTYGALTVQSIALNITGSWFIGNKAIGEQSYGGAVFIDTNLSLISSNVFTGNSATNGGAIYLISATPENVSNVYQGNKAVYGSDIASYAVSMSLLNGSVPIGVSGQVFTQEIYVELLDHYGQAVKTDNSSIAWISSKSSLAGNLKGTAYQGVFNFSQFTITATPNSTVTLSVSMGDLVLVVPLYLRACIQGEILSNKSCVLCQSGTYSLIKDATTCSTCLENAECPGNSGLYPRPGYWRPNEMFDQLFECPRASACLGNVNQTSSTGVCADGYSGNMCQVCANNYTRDGKDLCTTCLSQESFIIGQVFLASGIGLFLTILVTSSLTSANNVENHSGALFKIFLNYLHFTVLVAHFELLWPDCLEAMFHIYEYLGNSGEQFMSWDCSGRQSYYTQIVTTAVLPAVLILVNLVLWTLARYVLCTKQIANKLICSLTISLIFVHPLIVRVALSAFNCITIKPEEHWLRFEMDISCWDSTHLNYALGAALPALIIWGLFLPLGSLIILLRYRMQDNRLMRQRLSFLCVGYMQSRRYWELINICWKVLIIVVYVFTSYLNLSLQGLILCILLWVSAAVQQRFSPFESSPLNVLEQRSIWVSIITAFAGIWYSSQALSNQAEIVLFVLILLVHAYFLSLWIFLLIQTLWSARIKSHPQFGQSFPRLQRVFHITPATTQSVN